MNQQSESASGQTRDSGLTLVQELRIMLQVRGESVDLSVAAHDAARKAALEASAAYFGSNLGAPESEALRDSFRSAERMATAQCELLATNLMREREAFRQLLALVLP